uniref:PARP catalytic domain-containing protein n=1 Tax=Scophthalmus maximus TaxID=52904 RepID=A0A8D3AV71_SCOMX
ICFFRIRLGPSEPAPVSCRSYVMYHGTTRKKAWSIQATGFRQSAGGMLGCGVYLSRDLEKASRYPLRHPESDRVVIKVVVNVGNVVAINHQGHPLQKSWHDHGYNTAWVPPNCGMVKSGAEENCVWNHKRIQIIATIQPTPVSNSVRLGHSEPVSGRTYVMYHGTTRDHAWSIQDTGFHQSGGGMLGRGVYLTRDLEKASRYPIGHPESDRVVIKVVVKVGKVVAINRQGHPLQKSWHDHGYNTAWVPPNCGMVKSGAEENCVWNPKRIQIIKLIRPISTNDDDEDEEQSPSLFRLGPSEPAPVSCRSYVMYHGTTREKAWSIQATGFRQSAGGMLGCGVYLSRDLEKASRYPLRHPESDRVVIKVVVNVGNVVAINHQGHPLQKSWHDHGYDTAWVPPNCGMVKSGAEENCVWNHKRIQIIDLQKGIPIGCPVSGRTYVMYHGTTRDHAWSIQDTGFHQSGGGMLGRGVYLTRDLEKASRYPIGHPESDRVVIKVVVKVGKVVAINRQGHPLQKSWHDHGYNTAWVPPNCGMVKSGAEENCVWNPKRIMIIEIIRPTSTSDKEDDDEDNEKDNDEDNNYDHIYYEDDDGEDDVDRDQSTSECVIL